MDFPVPAQPPDEGGSPVLRLETKVSTIAARHRDVEVWIQRMVERNINVHAGYRRKELPPTQ